MAYVTHTKLRITMLAGIVFLSNNVFAQSHDLGNNLNAETETPFIRKNPDGVSGLGWPSRSPTGLMYGSPMQSPFQGNQDRNSARPITGYLEFGVIGLSGNEESSLFNKYSDWGDGIFVNRFGLRSVTVARNLSFNATGGSLGRDDQYISLNISRPNSFKLNAYFQSLRHIFATKGKHLWNSIGTGNLTLPSGITSETDGKSNLQNLLANLEGSRISLKREKGGLSASYSLTKQLKLDASVFHEWRKGSRPFGIGFSYPGFGQVMEVTEPIDYQTTDFRLTVDYNTRALTSLFSYHGSFFSNSIPSLTVENLGLSAFVPQYVAAKGRIALAPSNQYHMFSGDVAAPLSFWSGRFTLSARYSIASQDEALLPPTINDGQLSLPGQPVDLSDWNTVAALSQPSAEAKLSRLSLVSKILINPSKKMRLALKFRYDNEQNSTRYTALNPITGQYGYIAMDGGLGGVMPRLSGIYSPTFGSSRIRYRNIPYAKDLKQVSLDANYRLSRRTKLNLSLVYKEEMRKPREVETTQDFILKANISSRLHKLGTIRVSYEYLNRDGSAYNSNPYEAYNTSSFSALTPSNGFTVPASNLFEFRKYDLVAKDTHTLRAKINLILSETIDLAITGNLQAQNPHAEYGVRQIRSNTLNAEVTWQPMPQTSAYAFASRDYASRDVANINDTGAFEQNGNAGGPLYPLENVWTAFTKEHGISIGAGFKHEVGDWKFDVNYVYAKNRSEYDYGYASPSAFNNEFSVSEVGNGLPDQHFSSHTLSASANWLIRSDMQIRLLYRFENENLKDYHYQGLEQILVGNNLFLGAVPDSYSTHVLGALFAIRF